MIGFETIGNATVTCFDDVPVLSTDPWIDGSPYFGSWGHPTEIPTAVDYGLPTFVVDTDDTVGLHKRAIKMNTVIHSEPHEWSVRGATGDMIDFLGMSLFDPDGHFFEVNQRLG